MQLTALANAATCLRPRNIPIFTELTISYSNSQYLGRVPYEYTVVLYSNLSRIKFANWENYEGTVSLSYNAKMVFPT